MQSIRMAPPRAGVSTEQSLVACKVASTLWRELQEVIRMGDEDRCIWMSGTLQLELCA